MKQLQEEGKDCQKQVYLLEQAKEELIHQNSYISQKQNQLNDDYSNLDRQSQKMQYELNQKECDIKNYVNELSRLEKQLQENQKTFKAQDQ